MAVTSEAPRKHSDMFISENGEIEAAIAYRVIQIAKYVMKLADIDCSVGSTRMNLAERNYALALMCFQLANEDPSINTEIATSMALIYPSTGDVEEHTLEQLPLDIFDSFGLSPLPNTEPSSISELVGVYPEIPAGADEEIVRAQAFVDNIARVVLPHAFRAIESETEGATQYSSPLSPEILQIAEFVLQFREQKRAIYYGKEKIENDVEHSLMLAIAALYLAVEVFPDNMDTLKLVIQGLVHDMTEVVDGDVASWTLTVEEHHKKSAKEAEGLVETLNKIPGIIGEQLAEYSTHSSPEARFLRVLDKVLPLAVRLLAEIAIVRSALQNQYGLSGIDSYRESEEEYLRTFFEKFKETEGAKWTEVLLRARGVIIGVLMERLAKLFASE